MSVPDTSVIIASSFSGPTIPMIHRTAGNLLAALKAYLVDGWAERPVFSCAFDAQVGEIVVTFAEEHDYQEDQVINLTGITPADYNGRWKITERTPFTIRCPINTVPAGDGIDAGTGMFCRLAPAGWSIAHINLAETEAVFTNANGKQFLVENDEAVSNGYDGPTGEDSNYIRVDGATVYQAARIRPVKNVVDLANYEVVCDRTTNPMYPGGFVIACCYDHTATYLYQPGDAIYHDVIADGAGFHLMTDQYKEQNRSTSSWRYFGQLHDPGKVDRVVMCGVGLSSTDYTSPSSHQTSELAHFGGGYSDDNRVEYAKDSTNTPFGFYIDRGDTSGRGPFPFPTQAGEFLYSPEVHGMYGGESIGMLPGVAGVLHLLPLSHGTKFYGEKGVKWMAVNMAAPGSSTSPERAQVLFNISGPWRG